MHKHLSLKALVRHFSKLMNICYIKDVDLHLAACVGNLEVP